MLRGDHCRGSIVMAYEPGHSIFYKIACASSLDRSAYTSVQSDQSSQGTLWVAKDPKMGLCWGKCSLLGNAVPWLIISMLYEEKTGIL